jgi:hypothetical protein
MGQRRTTNDQEKRQFEFERLLADPSAIYVSPEELVSDSQLTVKEKVEVLRRWAYDADELAVAEEEGMTGEASGLLERILAALEQLGAEIDTDHTPPTKQGGI